MSTIRKQSLISSGIVYLGFVIGMFNIYLFTREGSDFTKEQYGLVNFFIAIANIFYAVASIGMPAYVTKFYPYYKSHLQRKENDQMTWALLIPCIGYGIAMLIGFVLKDWILKFFTNSPEFGEYYYWIYPFGFGFTLFMVLEALAWQERKSILSNLLKEVVFRLIVTLLIVGFTAGWIKDFDLFVSIYSFSYLALVLFLIIYLNRQGKLSFNFSPSLVTKRFFKKIRALVLYVYSGSLILNVAAVFDTLVLAFVLPNGMAAVAIFSLAQNIASLIQAPQRAIVSASVGPLSAAWKEKDFDRIRLIYSRSSINQLLFALGMFALIWLNFLDGIETFNLKDDYRATYWVFFIIAIARTLDMGTGVNAQIIGTSTYWKFEFKSVMISMVLMFPLSWQLTRYLGEMGPAIATLISYTIYNTIRFIFLYRKFRMQPFTHKTGLAILLAGGAYFIAYFLFRDWTGFLAMTVRSSLFLILFIPGIVLMKLSPDLIPVLQTIRKRSRV